MTDPAERSGPAPREREPRRVPAGGRGGAAAWRGAAQTLPRARQSTGRTALDGGHARATEDYLGRATCASFRMDGLPLTPEEFRAALAAGAAPRGCRSRSAQRVRNHAAILHRVELLLRRGQPLRAADVLRWYTSIACGLSSGTMAGATVARIEKVVSAVNSPRLRFEQAVHEVASLHADLLTDPFVPGFNGILARLLMRYHMGRCGLPPVVFDPTDDPPLMGSATKLEHRLLELLAGSSRRAAGG